MYSSENSDCTIANMGDQTVAVVGAENMLVVTINGATLVISRDKLPDLKKYLGELKDSGKFPSELF